MAWNRSTKDCRWARRASCFLASDCAARSRAALARRTVVGPDSSVSFRSSRCRIPPTARFRRPRSWLIDQHGVGIARQIGFKPERPFKVEVVRRLVQQQAGRVRKTGRPPARRASASRRKRPSRACAALRRSKPRPLRIEAARAFGGPGVDIGKARLDLGDAAPGRWRFRPRPSGSRARYRRPAPCRSATPRCRAPLGDAADRGARGRVIAPPSSASSPRMMRNSVVLPVPLRPTMPTLWPSGMTGGGFFDQRTARDGIVIFFNAQHGRGVPIARAPSIAAFQAPDPMLSERQYWGGARALPDTRKRLTWLWNAR